MPDIHSKFPPSSAERHLNCTPSLLMEAQFPNAPINDAALEGTYAHWVAENKLRTLLGLELNEEKPDWNSAWNAEEIDALTDKYIDFIRHIALESDALKIIPESTVYFDRWVPGGFGTSDCIVLGPTSINIIDLKYGRVKVEYTDNTQLKIYALGVYQTYGKDYKLDDEITMSIFQPRCGNTGTYRMTIRELISWAETYVVPRAKAALEGKGEPVEGSWCTYCKAKAICRKHTAAVRELFDTIVPDKTLTDDEIAKYLPHIKDMISWCEDILSHAISLTTENNKEWPGMELSYGRTSRSFEDQASVIAAAKAKGLTDDDLYKKTLLTPKQLEDTLGAEVYEDIFKGFEVKKPGKPTLIPKKGA